VGRPFRFGAVLAPIAGRRPSWRPGRRPDRGSIGVRSRPGRRGGRVGVVSPQLEVSAFPKSGLSGMTAARVLIGGGIREDAWALIPPAIAVVFTRVHLFMCSAVSNQHTSQTPP